MKAKYIILIVVVLVLGVLIYINRDWFAKKLAAPDAAQNSNTGGTSGTNTGTGTSNTANTGYTGSMNTGTSVSSGGLNYNLLLKKGMIAPEVGELQKLLNSVEPSNPLVVDNNFGPLTEAKLKRNNGNVATTTLNQMYAKLASYTAAATTGSFWGTIANWFQ